MAMNSWKWAIRRGRGLGEILFALEDEQLEGRISTKEEARDFARRNFPVPKND